MHHQQKRTNAIQTHRMVQEAPVDAGDFADWLAQTLRGLHTGAPAPVPCGDCRGCCSSGYFIPLTPADSAAVMAIPAPLLSPAPGMPPGYQVLGRTAQGACPMLEHNTCGIYPARPQACRAYDCRVFAAAGMAAGTDSFSRINARVRAWRFSYGSHHAGRPPGRAGGSPVHAGEGLGLPRRPCAPQARRTGSSGPQGAPGVSAHRPARPGRQRHRGGHHCL
ncbi:MAG: YkgJ family cysteine cluster protein [Acidovorax sp.]|nr:YkgJ family cysteine cluster protein [Acidovorax sp.]